MVVETSYKTGTEAMNVAAGVESLLERGYFVIEGALSLHQCASAIRVLDELVEKGQSRELPGFGYHLNSVCELDRRLCDLYCQPLLLATVRELFADEVRIAVAGARLSEPRHTPRLGWHIHRFTDDECDLHPGDLDRGSHPERVVCAFYLEGCSEESGPLVVLPRRYDDVLSPPVEGMCEAWPGEVAVLCPPGSCVMFTTDMWHAALAGTGNGRRHLVGAHFQGWNNPRAHREDHIHEGPEVEEAARRNPVFAGLVGRSN